MAGGLRSLLAYWLGGGASAATTPGAVSAFAIWTVVTATATPGTVVRSTTAVKTTWVVPSAATQSSITRSTTSVRTVWAVPSALAEGGGLINATPVRTVFVVPSAASSPGAVTRSASPATAPFVVRFATALWSETSVATPAVTRFVVPSAAAELLFWVDIAEFVEIELTSPWATPADPTVKCSLWAGTGGVSVRARLLNVTDGTSVGQSASVTSTSPVWTSFSVTLATGTKRYRLQVGSASASVDLFCQSGGLYL